MTPVGEVDSRSDNVGINLSAYRPPGLPNQTSVSNSRYVVLPPNALPIATRLIMHAEFDLPDTPQVPGLPPSSLPAWAVGLRVKFGGADDVMGEPFAIVTCQFQLDNITVPGVRLNTPGSEQRDQADNLDTPIDYAKYRGHASPNASPAVANAHGLPTLFSLDYAFGGAPVGPAPGHAVGCGALSIGTKTDQRVFSTTTLGSSNQSWIGALGISLSTSKGEGTIAVRLRLFSVSLIAPGTLP